MQPCETNETRWRSYGSSSVACVNVCHYSLVSVVTTVIDGTNVRVSRIQYGRSASCRQTSCTLFCRQLQCAAYRRTRGWMDAVDRAWYLLCYKRRMSVCAVLISPPPSSICCYADLT